MDLKEFGNRFVPQTELISRSVCSVYVASDRNLADKLVALKVFNVDLNPEKTEEFNAQVKLLRAASHPALIPIIAGGTEKTKPYIAMELIDGLSIEQLIEDAGGRLSVEQALQYLQELAGGLHEIHEAGSIHGHIDANSIIFKGKDLRIGGYCPAVIDQTLGFKETIYPAFMAPEQFNDQQVTPQTDVFAISVLAYRMLTGEFPFKGHTVDEVSISWSTAPQSLTKLNAEVPALVDAAVLKGLSISAKDRFKSCLAFIDAATGGKKPIKNPLAAIAEQEAERLIGGSGGETIAVSMSTEVLKQMLQAGAGSSTASAIQNKQPETIPSAKYVNGGSRSEPTKEANEELDVASTVMGMQTSSVLSGSVVFTSGEDKGRKITLDKAQTMIGADAGCDIVIKDKNVSSRYAIIVRRGSEYFIAALSAKKLVLDGQEVPGMEEQLLKRGDIINAGKVNIRFIAPGEVFTLQDDVADRVIDRPKSKLPLIVISALVMVAIITGIGIYLHQDSVEQAKLQAGASKQKEQKERGQLVAQLIKEGDEFFRTQQYIEPVGASAKDRFLQVLNLDPMNGYAKRRIAEIDNRVEQLHASRVRDRETVERIKQLEADADRYFRNGDYLSPPGRNAKETYERIISLDPKNEIATSRLTEINDILSDLLMRVEVWLSKADVFITLGQFITPEQENAFNFIQRTLKVDPNNERAKEMLLEMAAMSILRGDEAKRAGDVESLEIEYEAALVLGINPDYLAPRKGGLDLIRRSRGSVILPPVKYDFAKLAESDKSGNFLGSQEIERRVAALKLKTRSTAGPQRVWDLSSSSSTD